MKYSIDKIKIMFKHIKTNEINDFLKELELCCELKYYSSMHLTKCKHNFVYSQDNNREGTIYVGVVPNWLKESRFDKCIVLEYNPNKVNPFSFDKLEWLARIPRGLWYVMNFDIAVDIPIAYNTITMLKRDKREYFCTIGHSETETRYLSKANANGSIKLYNKALEQKINADWTRFEITIKDIHTYCPEYSEFDLVCKLPALYRIDTQLSTSYMRLNSVWRLALDTVVKDATMLYSIDDFKTRKKMEQLLHECLESVQISKHEMYNAYLRYFDTIALKEDDSVVDIASIFHAQDMRNKAIAKNRLRLRLEK